MKKLCLSPPPSTGRDTHANKQLQYNKITVIIEVGAECCGSIGEEATIGIELPQALIDRSDWIWM